VSSNQFYIDGSVVWNAGNDGAGSGLDADLLDGQHGTYYYAASNPNGYTSNTGTVTSVATGDGLSGGTITTTGTLTVNSTVIRTTGNQSMAGIKTFTGGVALDSKVTMTDSAYFTGAPSYGFRWNSNSDAFNNVIMYDNGNVYVRGSMGLGTTSMTETLNVVGHMFMNASAGYGIIRTLDQYHGLIMRGYPNNATTGYTAGDYMSFFEYGGIFRFYLKNGSALTLQGELNGGSLTVTGNITAYGTPSDRKLKENIRPLNDSLHKVMQLRGVSFDWREGTKEAEMVKMKEDIGFIAQEVQAVSPELARVDEQSGIMAVRDRGIIALLVEAVKEQQKQIDELKDELYKYKGDTTK
jgi:hypothetical protein